MAEAAKVKADQIIKENPVAVFSKSYCPYCKAAKTLLSEMGAKPYIVELDQVDDGAQLQDALYEISQQSTVPNIFIRDSGKGGDNGHIGGNDKLQAKRAELPKLLKNAGAI